MAGHVGEGYTNEIEHALAYTPTAELLELPFLAPDQVRDSGQAYTLAKRASVRRHLGCPRRPRELPQPRHHLLPARAGRDDQP